MKPRILVIGICGTCVALIGAGRLPASGVGVGNRVWSGKDTLRTYALAADVAPVVSPTLSYDSAGKRYVLTLSVRNAPGAKNAIAAVAMEPFGTRPTSGPHPAHWYALWQYEDHDSAVVWVCLDTLNRDQGDWDAKGRPQASPFMIPPGSRTFVFKTYASTMPPRLRVFVQGYVFPADYDDAPSVFSKSWQQTYRIDVGEVGNGGVPQVIAIGRPKPNRGRSRR